MVESKVYDKGDTLVTIRCMTYNQAPYIRQCLEGFVMQKTNFRFNAVVHDDASTDGTDVVIAEFAQKYPDIIIPYYEVENQYSKRDGSLMRIMNHLTSMGGVNSSHYAKAMITGLTHTNFKSR